MRLLVTDLQGEGFRQVATEHKGVQLIWETRAYGKVRLAQPTQVFDEINAFFATLSDDEQDTIFAQYKEIKETLDEMIEPIQMEHMIKTAVMQIYQVVTLERIDRWMMNNYTLHIPVDTKDTLDPRDMTSKSSKTYLVHDYRALAVLALTVRPMLPVWGEYIDQVAPGNGNLYKEMDAVGLLGQTDLMTSPAVDKLTEWLTALSDSYPITMPSLLRGLSADEIPVWLQALVLVRRLPILALSENNPAKSQNRNIVANIHSYVGSQLKPDQHQQDKRVKPKRTESDSWEDEDNKTSLFENYKIKQEITDGDAVLNEVYVKNMAGLAQRIDNSVDLSKLQICMRHSDQMATHLIEDHQIHLTQWVCGRVVSGRATAHHMIKARVIQQMIVTQAMLWHWGFIDLAMLMTVHGAALVDEKAPMIASGTRTNTRFKDHQIQQLEALYPHRKHQKTTRFENQYNNVAINDVAIMARQIFKQDWRYYGPPEIRELSEQNYNQNIVAVPSTIKNQLVDLVIRFSTL